MCVLFNLFINADVGYSNVRTEENIVICRNVEYIGVSVWQGVTITLKITGIDLAHNSFVGLFKAGENYEEMISGSFQELTVWQGEGYTHNLSFSVNWNGGGDYNLDFSDSEGSLSGTTTAEATVFGYHIGVPSSFYGNKYMIAKAINQSEVVFNNDLFVFCRDCSKAVYSKEMEGNCPKELRDFLVDNKYTDIVPNYIKYGTFHDNNDQNVSYVIAHKKVNNKERIIVVIRGTDGVEWEGNFKIYSESEMNNIHEGDSHTHNNFSVAAEFLEEEIENYCNKNFNNIDNELIITGHSRGGAVSNLVAKNLTVSQSFLPTVISYTFATPSVAVKTVYNSMESYNNIFNYCRIKDFVPYIPLVNDNWNYWKYGKTYVNDYYDADVYCNKITSIMANNNYAPNVKEYYNKKFKKSKTDSHPISLYNYLNETIVKNMEEGIKYKKIKKNLKYYRNNYKGLSKLSSQMRKNVEYIGFNHLPNIYESMNESQFTEYSYSEALSRTNGNRRLDINTLNTFEQSKQVNNTSVRNLAEIQQIQLFLNSADDNNVSNLTKLGWDINDTDTWTGITFNNTGNVVAIDLEFKDLYGVLNLSGFTYLTDVNVSSNWITSVITTGCTSLTNLDVSDNELTSLNISANTALTSLNLG